jgi:GTP-binding protein
MGPAISAFSVRQMSPNEWLVRGSGVERLAQMTNWQYFESVLRFQNMLRRAGVEQELARQGAADGDTVAIGAEVELEFDTSKDASTLHAAWLAERQALGAPSRGTSTWPRAA